MMGVRGRTTRSEVYCLFHITFFKGTILIINYKSLNIGIMKEIWKDIIGYEGLYRISDQGRIFSVKSGKIRETFVSNSGYKMIHLYKNGTDRHFTVHRLVADNFIPNPFDFKEINHINENKLDNRAENLEWCNRKYNQEYSGNIRKWVNAGANGNKVASSRKIARYTKEGILLNVYIGAREVERMIGYSHQSIGRVCLGKQKTAYGYVWKYLD